MRAVITGASSGIGLALARELGKRGYALALLARRAEPMEQAARELPRAVAIACDVTDDAAVGDAVRRAENELGGPFDLAVANAGLSIRNNASRFQVADAEEVYRVNVFGMFHLFGAVVPSMVERRSGRFVGVASLAGLRGLPSGGPYSSSKAAMQAFLEAARVDLAPFGVGVTIVNPGFIDTPMTAKNKFRMPFLMTPEKAAARIARGIEQGRRVVNFPLPMSIITHLLRYLPDPVYDRVMVRRT